MNLDILSYDHMTILETSTAMHSSGRIIHTESTECSLSRRPSLINSIPERKIVIEIAKESNPFENTSVLRSQFARNVSGFTLPILFYR